MAKVTFVAFDDENGKVTVERSWDPIPDTEDIDMFGMPKGLTGAQLLGIEIAKTIRRATVREEVGEGENG